MLTGCATAGSEPSVVAVCPPVVEYGAEFRVRAAEELELLPEASAVVEMLADYAVKASKHLEGAAFDVAMANHDPAKFEAAAREAGFLGFGFYPEARHDFMHIDIGPAREWGTRWPVTAATFTPEPPAPKPLAQSRTMRGSGAAGLATVGAAGVEMAQEVITETQVAVEPLVPYLDTLRWVFIGVALLGIGIAVYARWDDWRRGER